MKTKFAAYDDFNGKIAATHRTMKAAVISQNRLNHKLAIYGFSAIYTVVAIDDDGARWMTGDELVDLDITQWEVDSN